MPYSVIDFASRIKSKYPAYSNVDDRELVERILAKYPVYRDSVDLDSVSFAPATAPAANQYSGILPSAQFSPEPTSTTGLVLDTPIPPQRSVVTPEQVLGGDPGNYPAIYRPRNIAEPIRYEEVPAEAAVAASGQVVGEKSPEVFETARIKASSFDPTTSGKAVLLAPFKVVRGAYKVLGIKAEQMDEDIEDIARRYYQPKYAKVRGVEKIGTEEQVQEQVQKVKKAVEITKEWLDRSVKEIDYTIPDGWEQEIQSAMQGTLNPLESPTEALNTWATNIADQTRFFMMHALTPVGGAAGAAIGVGEEFIDLARQHGFSDEEIGKYFDQAVLAAGSLEYAGELATLGVGKKIPGVNKLPQKLLNFLGKGVLRKIGSSVGSALSEGLTEYSQQSVMNYYLGKMAKDKGWDEETIRNTFKNEPLLQSRDFWVGAGIGGFAGSVRGVQEAAQQRSQAIDESMQSEMQRIARVDAARAESTEGQLQRLGVQSVADFHTMPEEQQDDILPRLDKAAQDELLAGPGKDRSMPDVPAPAKPAAQPASAKQQMPNLEPDPELEPLEESEEIDTGVDSEIPTEEGEVISEGQPARWISDDTQESTPAPLSEQAKNIIDVGKRVDRDLADIQDTQRRKRLSKLFLDDVLRDYNVTTFSQIEEIQKELEASNIPYVYERTDGLNVGGLNELRGTHDAANEDLRAVWGEIYATEVQKNGGVIARNKGDEFIVLWPEKSLAEVEKIRYTIEEKLAQRVEELGLTEVPHPKHGGLITGALYTDYGLVDVGPDRQFKFGQYGDIDRAADKISEKSKADRIGVIRESRKSTRTPGDESQNVDRRRAGRVPQAGNQAASQPGDRSASSGKQTQPPSTKSTPELNLPKDPHDLLGIGGIVADYSAGNIQFSEEYKNLSDDQKLKAIDSKLRKLDKQKKSLSPEGQQRIKSVRKALRRRRRWLVEARGRERAQEESDALNVYAVTGDTITDSRADLHNGVVSVLRNVSREELASLIDEKPTPALSVAQEQVLNGEKGDVLARKIRKEIGGRIQGRIDPGDIVKEARYYAGSDMQEELEGPRDASGELMFSRRKEQDDDTQRQGWLPGREREGEEPGRAVSEQEAGAGAAEAGGVFQAQEGEIGFREQQVRSPEFKAWFGDWESNPANASKVVDENGEPLVVYHGTAPKSKKGFTVFDEKKQGQTDWGMRGGNAFYFSSESGYASMYGGKSGANQIMPVYLDIKNPLDLSNMTKKDAQNLLDALNKRRIQNGRKTYAEQWGADKEAAIIDDFVNAKPTFMEDITKVRGDLINNLGGEEVVRLAGYDGVISMNGKEIAVFSPAQIKSATGNRGTFDPNDPNIMYNRRSGQQPAGRAATAQGSQGEGQEITLSGRQRVTADKDTPLSPGDLQIIAEEFEQTIGDYLSPELAQNIRLRISRHLTHQSKVHQFRPGENAAVQMNPKIGMVTVTINPDIAPEKIASALVHEIPGHYGALTVMHRDPEFRRRLMPFFRSKDAKNQARLQELRDLYGDDQETLFREWVAKAMEDYSQNPQPGVLRQIWNAVRDWLVRMGLSKDQVDDVMRAMVREMKTAQPTPEAFSVESRAWPKDFPGVFVQTTTAKLKRHPQYDAAKAGDADAAMQVARDLVKDEKAAALKERFPDAILVPVMAVEASGRNQLANMLATELSTRSGLKAVFGIVQTNEVKHTGASAIKRLLAVPKFDGDIIEGGQYILVDDVVTSGSTFNALRRYIEENGGTVVAASSFHAVMDRRTGAYGGYLPVQQKTLDKIEKNLTIHAVNSILQEYGIANEIEELTEGQARNLALYSSIDSLRDRLAQEGTEGRDAQVRETGTNRGRHSEEITPPPLFARSKYSESEIRKAVSQAYRPRSDSDIDFTEVEALQRAAKSIKSKLTHLQGDLKETRAEIELQIREYQAEAHDKIRNMIYDYARKIGLRGEPYNRVDTFLKNIKTSSGLRKAIEAMDTVMEQRVNRKLRRIVDEKINAEYMRLGRMRNRTQPTTDIVENRALLDYLNNLTSEKGSKLDKIQKSLNWFLQHSEQEMPESLQEDVQNLFRRRLDEMSNKELSEIIVDIDTLKKYGRLKWKIREEQETRRIDEVVEKASQELTVVTKAQRESPLESALKPRGKYESLKITAQKYGWGHIRPERIIEWMAGWKKGAFKQAVWDPILAAENTKSRNTEKALSQFETIHQGLNAHEAMHQPFMTIWVQEIKENRKEEPKPIKLTLDQAMFIYANSQNPGNRAHLYGTGVHDAVIDQVVNQLPVEYRVMVDQMIDYFDTDQYGRINEVFSAEHQVDMPKEYRYFPIMNLKTDRAENQLMADLLARYSSRHGAIQKGMTKSRVNSKAAFRRMSYLETVVRSMQQAEHYIAFGPAVKSVNAIINSPVLNEAMEMRSKEAAAQIRDWVRAAAYGKIAGSEHPIDKVSDWLRTNYVTAILGFNVVTMLKQPASFSQGIAQISKPDVVRASGQFIRNPKEIFHFVEEHSDMMRNRVNSFERELAEMMEKSAVKRALGVESWLEKAKEVSMQPIQQADRITTNILWYAKFQEQINLGVTEQSAINAADELIRKTQPMGGVIHLPSIYRGGGIARAYTMFTNQLNQNLNLNFEMASDFAGKTTKEKIDAAVFYWIIPSMLIYMASSGGRPPWKDPEGWARAFVSNITGGMMIANKLIDSAMLRLTSDIKKARGGKSDMALMHYLADFTPTSFGAVKDAAGLLQSKDAGQAFERFAEMSLKLKGIPYSQARRTVKGAKITWETRDPRYLIWAEGALRDPSVDANMKAKLQADSLPWEDKLDLLKWWQKQSPKKQAKLMQEVLGVPGRLKKMKNSLATQPARFAAKAKQIANDPEMTIEEKRQAIEEVRKEQEQFRAKLKGLRK